MKGKKLKCVVFLLFASILCASCLNVDTRQRGGVRRLMQEEEETEPAEFGATAKWLHSLPRNAIGGGTVEPSLFVAPTEGYVTSLAAMGIVALAVGFIAIIAGIMFCCLRFCFDSCGGKQRRDSGYSNKERLLIKIFTFINALFIVAMIVLGIIGNSLFTEGLEVLASNVDGEAQKQSNLINTIEPALLSVNEERTRLRGYVAALTRDATETVDNAQLGKDYVEENDLLRIVLLSITYGFVLISIVLTLVAALFNLGTVPMGSSFISFFGIFLMWFTIAVHFPFSVAVSDMCYDLVEVGIQTKIDERIADKGELYGESGLDSFCFCPNWDNANRTYYWTIELKEIAIQERQGLVNRSTPLSPQEQARYNELSQQISLLENTEVNALYARDCRWLMYALSTPVKNSMCGDNMSGLVLIWSTSFVASVLLIPWTVLSIMGHKRFPVFVDVNSVLSFHVTHTNYRMDSFKV